MSKYYEFDDDAENAACDEARFMADTIDDEEYEPGICPHCSGSGEGQNEGSRCSYCRGRGEI